MSLGPGAKLGSFEVVSPLGSGGMGEVYRARDTKLNRDVALKVLPETFAADPQRMARFEREAQVLASLNHPNIAALYGLEESGSVRALVMELVEGQTLAEKIVGADPRVRPGSGTTSGALMGAPLQDTLAIARQVAEALEYAHERGIVHRDLKPANVKITPDGTVKVLDFGLAKAMGPDEASRDISNSPTLSAAMTQAGFILGTAAYMSPEQAKAKPVDRRADIWAFGCVLYEMLTGRCAFGRADLTDTIVAVMKEEPDWDALPQDTPAAIEKLIRRCLTKDRKQRLQSIGEARITIEETLSGESDVGAQRAVSLPEGPSPPLQRTLPWALFGAAVIALGVVFVGYVRRAPKSAQTLVAQLSPPPGARFALGGQTAGPPVLSPDGMKLAFSAIASDGAQLLWVRPLNSASAQPLAGTDGATYPFWSPDGKYLGFFARGKLNRIEASGGPTLALCDAPSARGGTWGPDGTILFTPDITSGIYRVPSAGGAPKISAHARRIRRKDRPLAAVSSGWQAFPFLQAFELSCAFRRHVCRVARWRQAEVDSPGRFQRHLCSARVSTLSEPGHAHGSTI